MSNQLRTFLENYERNHLYIDIPMHIPTYKKPGMMRNYNLDQKKISAVPNEKFTRLKKWLKSLLDLLRIR